jgi:orotidine-5'-phosphate decarboxylase
LDTDITKIPAHLLTEEDPVFSFNKIVIDATKEFAVAYKINLAFYEADGLKGWKSLEKTVNYIPKNIFKIADAKRGDIGNTSTQYAKAFFEHMNFDAITVSPYMGIDSVKPFMSYENKWIIILALTSNSGSNDFQMLKTEEGPLYEVVLKKAAGWGSDENTMFVVGATHPKNFENIRKLIPNHFMLIPGVGAQGGSLDEIAKYALNEEVGVLVNVSRAVIFPDDKAGFPNNIYRAAQDYQQQMAKFIKSK